MQHRMTNGAPGRIRKQNKFSQFRLSSTKVIPIDLSQLHFDNEQKVQERQGVKDQQFYMQVPVACVTYPRSSYENQSIHDLAIHTSQQYSIQGRMVNLIEIPSKLGIKKLHRKNQDSDFLGENFSNRDRVRIMFSKVIREIQRLVLTATQPDSQGVWDNAASSPIGGLGAKPQKILPRILSKCKKTVYSLTLFGVLFI